MIGLEQAGGWTVRVAIITASALPTASAILQPSWLTKIK